VSQDHSPVQFSAARCIALATLLASLAGSAAAQEAYISGPSVVSSRGGVAVIQGANFRPNQPLMVVVTSPSGTDVVYSTVADAQGKVAYSFSPAEPGPHVLKVGETISRKMPSANVVALP
jgi:hypothetical protein